MGSRRSFNQRVTVKRQITLQRAVATGCVLAGVIGIAVFFYLNLSNSADSLAANMRFYAVKPGDWIDPVAWENGTVPAARDINHDIEILGRVVRRGSLAYQRGSGKTLTVKDTLVVEGHLTLGNKSNLTVHENGVLMVGGDFSVDKKSEITNYGTIAVGGAWKVRSLNKIDYRGDSSQLFHLGEVWADEEPVRFGQTGEALQREHASVYALVKQKSDALKPIFFTATLRGGDVVTQWQAESEATYTSFTVEKSTDGAVFRPLVVVPGETNSMMPVKNSYTDPTPASGVSYYRLKRVGPDNTLAYSQLAMVANWGEAFSGGSVGQ